MTLWRILWRHPILSCLFPPPAPSPVHAADAGWAGWVLKAVSGGGLVPRKLVLLHRHLALGRGEPCLLLPGCLLPLLTPRNSPGLLASLGAAHSCPCPWSSLEIVQFGLDCNLLCVALLLHQVPGHLALQKEAPGHPGARQGHSG